MSLTGRTGEISSDILTSVKMIDHSSKNNNKSLCDKSPGYQMKNTSMLKRNLMGNNLTVQDFNNNIFKDIMNGKVIDNKSTGKVKENSMNWISQQSPKLGGDKTLFHPAVVASSFGAFTSSTMSHKSYIPKMSYCNFNRCYQNKFKQKYFTNLSCASVGQVGFYKRNNTPTKHIPNHCDKTLDKSAEKSSQPQTKQSISEPDKNKMPARLSSIDIQEEEEKNDVFGNRGQALVNDWIDLCTDDETDEGINSVVPDCWEDDIDNKGKKHVQCKAQVKSDSHCIPKEENEKKKVDSERKNIPNINIKINSITPSGNQSDGGETNGDKTCVLFMRKDNKKCRPSSKKRRRSKARKREEDNDEKSTDGTSQKPCKNQNSPIAFMLGFNKTCDNSENNLQPTHSFYVTFEDSDHSSDWSDGEFNSDNCSEDELDGDSWLGSDSFGSEFNNPLSLNLICSVKQCTNDSDSQKELKDINTAWEIQIRRRPSSSSLDKKEKDKSAKKVHFPENEKIAEVHHMIAWSYAYEEARKGPWHQYALDNERFQRRIQELEKIISPVLKSEHRDKMYSSLNHKN